MTQDSNQPAQDFGPTTDAGLDGLASVILIDRREDIGAICGRVDASPTYAVVIHAPRGNRTLSSELGMRRLRRHAEESGKLIAIATRSSGLASRARQIGLPTARRPEHIRWDAPGRRIVRVFGRSLAAPHIGRFAQFLAIVVLAGVVGWLMLAIAPAAELTVVPPTETLTKTIIISAKPGRSGIDFTNFEVPASKVTATQRITLALRTTGKLQVGTKAAKVVVAMTNPAASDLAIPAGAELITAVEGVSYILDLAVNVPKGQTVNGQATAARPGILSNLPAASVKAFADPKYLSIAVTNAAAAAGGANEERAAVDANDIVAINALAKGLETSDGIKATIVTARPHDAVVLRTAETTLEIGDVSAPVGTVIDLILLPVDVKVTAVAILQETLDEVARHVLQQDQGVGEFIPGSVTAAETGARQSNADDGTIRTELLVKGDFARKLTRASVADAVKGLSPQDARSTLATQYGIQDSRIDLSPGWAPWLPRFDFRIEVIFKAPATPTSTPAATPTSPATTTAALSARTPAAN